MDSANIVIRPLITEKGTRLQISQNTYAFEVQLDANKCQIKHAIEKLYNVKVDDVRTIVRKGKPRRSRYRLTHTSKFKRAIVCLHEDSKIEMF
jgi:large subunit ribosomal protein L23